MAEKLCAGCIGHCKLEDQLNFAAKKHEVQAEVIGVSFSEYPNINLVPAMGLTLLAATSNAILAARTQYPDCPRIDELDPYYTGRNLT